MSQEADAIEHPAPQPESRPDAERGGSWMRLLNFGARKRVPVILQAETTECGLACLAMVASYRGYRTDLLSLRSRFPISLRGARLQDLMDIAHAVGLAPRPVQVELEKLNHLDVPCILHWNMNHFVVLTGFWGKKTEIIDPAVGRRTLSESEMSRGFTGVALELEAGPDLQRKEARQPVSLRNLAGSISGLKKGLLQIFGLALLLEFFALLAPQFLRIVLDQVVAHNDQSLLTFLGISFLGLLFLKTLIEGLRTWTMMWLSANMNIGWTGNVFNHLLKLPLEYFSKRYLGDIISRFSSINAIQQTLTTQFVAVIIDGLMASLTIVMLSYYSWKLTVLTVCFAFAYAALRIAYYRIFREATLNQINVTAYQQSALIESLRGMQAVRLNNRSSQRSAKYMNSTADVINTSIVVQRLNLVFESLNSMTSGSQRILVLWLGAWFALQGEMTAGTLIAFVAYADMFTNRFVALADHFVQFRLLRLHGERLADIVLTPPEKYAEGSFAGNLKSYGIKCSNLTFQYNLNSRPVLDDCSFEVKDGEIVAITGVSGSGKSTIAKILLGVVDYAQGSVSIGNVDVRSLGKRRCRDLMASVLQDDELFSGSVFENIAFFDPSATLERVERAAECANLADSILALPMGYQTPIGDMGSSLSGGQYQRLLLARAFYREPHILILDEATSQLDLESERLICEAVRGASITTLVIAHRPQTVAIADRVLRLVDGRLIELSKDDIEDLMFQRRDIEVPSERNLDVERSEA